MLKGSIQIQEADMNKTIAMAAMLGILGTAFIALPARADDDGWRGHQGRDWQENRGRENEWRGHERVEDRGGWREYAHRSYPYYYATPPVNAYYYPPPPVVTYAPQPYYAPPGVSFYFGDND